MGFLGSTALYPTVTPAADDLVPIIQASSGEQRTASVSGLTGTASELVVALTGTSHGILASYRSKLVTFSNAAAVAASLPQAGVTFPDGWFTDVKNIGAGTVTITPTTSTIDGAATLVLTTGKSCRIVSDGTNYRTIFITGTVDADDVTYTPTTPADWDGGVDPGDVEQALDQLAERVVGLEGGSSGGVATDTIWNAAGDLVYGTGSDTGARLAIGTARQSLRVNSAGTAPEWFGNVVCIPIACSDETTALTAGTAKVTFRMPFPMTLLSGAAGVRASVTTAPTGSALTVDINEAGTTILSTKLTIDATEKTSTTAATPAVISDTSLADDAEMTIDIDGVGSTIAGAGLKVYLIGYVT